jgi:hypothetical protein
MSAMKFITKNWWMIPAGIAIAAQIGVIYLKYFY